MKKRKIRIVMREAVRDIRGGLDDVELMQKYGLSATKVESLFHKLVAAGALSECDLDQRMRKSQRSHVVEVDGIPDNGEGKTEVKASEILKALESGMSDIGLMNQYNLSVKGLNSLYSKLVAMGKIDRAELDVRRGSPNREELGQTRGELKGTLIEDQWDERSYANLLRHDAFWERNKVWFAAGIGASVGMALLAAALMICKSGMTSSSLSAWINSLGRPVTNSQPPEPAHVVNTSQAGATSEHTSTRDECLKRCKAQYVETDDVEKTFLTDCKRDCIAQHSLHIRRIRDRFYKHLDQTQ